MRTKIIWRVDDVFHECGLPLAVNIYKTSHTVLPGLKSYNLQCSRIQTLLNEIEKETKNMSKGRNSPGSMIECGIPNVSNEKQKTKHAKNQQR